MQAGKDYFDGLTAGAALVALSIEESIEPYAGPRAILRALNKIANLFSPRPTDYEAHVPQYRHEWVSPSTSDGRAAIDAANPGEVDSEGRAEEASGLDKGDGNGDRDQGVDGSVSDSEAEDEWDEVKLLAAEVSRSQSQLLAWHQHRHQLACTRARIGTSYL
eukprot:gene30620-35631_t